MEDIEPKQEFEFEEETNQSCASRISTPSICTEVEDNPEVTKKEKQLALARSRWCVCPIYKLDTFFLFSH